MKDKNQGFLDRVFLHGKNADERLFDLILRSLTFIVLLLFLVLYCSLNVHADNLTIAQYYNIDFSKLNVSNDNSLLWRSEEYSYCLQNYTDIAYNSNFHPPFNVPNFVTNIPLQDDFIKSDCYTIYAYAGAGLNGLYFYFIPKDVIDSDA